MEQPPKTKIFLKDQATDKAANAILILLAKILGKAKHIKLKMETINKNLAGSPKLVPAAFHPVMVNCFDAIYTNGCVVKNNNINTSKKPIV